MLDELGPARTELPHEQLTDGYPGGIYVHRSLTSFHPPDRVYPPDDVSVVTLANSDRAHLYNGHLARRIVRKCPGPVQLTSSRLIEERSLGFQWLVDRTH